MGGGRQVSWKPAMCDAVVTSIVQFAPSPPREWIPELTPLPFLFVVEMVMEARKRRVWVYRLVFIGKIIAGEGTRYVVVALKLCVDVGTSMD